MPPLFWQSSFVPVPLPPAAFVFRFLMIAKPRESVLWGCLSSSSCVCVSFSSYARTFCRFCIQVLMNILNPADMCACKHHSFCCANYKSSKSKDFKQSRKLSIMLICFWQQRKNTKKPCDCNHFCHDLTRICAVITQHCEGWGKSDDRQTLSALFLPVCLLLVCEILQILHSPF